ncbi:unnamed protein product [Linum trigynum]|uniref:Uncharacterized protein n=1 Tax=Linum trigynum TaxID=586398 RepID=A0AAV2CVY1_9ROSI
MPTATPDLRRAGCHHRASGARRALGGRDEEEEGRVRRGVVQEEGVEQVPELADEEGSPEQQGDVDRRRGAEGRGCFPAGFDSRRASSGEARRSPHDA